MKIFDCCMYFDEEMILDIRLNTLDKYVDFFVIVESEFYHNGKKRNLKFQIKNFEKFKNKIIYIPQKKEPEGTLKINENDDEGNKSYKLIFNAHLRENEQRNQIDYGISSAKDNDLILISDVDEIPNLKSINFNKINNKIIMFEQDIFYYKLNRYLPNFLWHGTKGCKKKNLKNPQWLRNIKSKKFPFWRIDTLLSETKYIDKFYIKNGGWHFSNVKKFEDIELKLKSYLHHRDYEVEELGLDKIEDLVNKNQTIYDMYGDKTSKKYGEDKRKKLEKYDLNKLPIYIQDNKDKFKEWID